MSYLKTALFTACLFFIINSPAKAEDRLDPLRKPITVQEIQDAAKKPWDIEYDRAIISRAAVSHLEREAYHVYKSKTIRPQFEAEAHLLRGLTELSYFDSIMNPMLNQNSAHVDYELANKLMAAARIDLDTAFRLKPDAGIICSIYGIFQFSSGGNRKKGLVLLRKGVDLIPKNSYSHQVLGRGLYMLGSNSSNKDAKAEIQEAEQEFRKAIALSPDYAAPHRSLADMYIVQKRYPEAQKELDAFLSHGTEKDAQAPIVLLFQKQITEGLNKRN